MPCFNVAWTGEDGKPHEARIHGDPNMAEETLKALCRLMELAEAAYLRGELPHQKGTSDDRSQDNR